MIRYKKWVTAAAALSIVGVLAGCSTGISTSAGTTPTNATNQSETNHSTITANNTTRSNTTSAVGTQSSANQISNNSTAPTTSNTVETPTNVAEFSGSDVKLLKGQHTPVAISKGYKGAQPNMTFSNQKFLPIEGFTGTLHGKKFVLDFYSNQPNGIVIGVRYNNKPVYFGFGPSPMFDVLNFTGDNVVLGSPSAGAYMTMNLVTGKVDTNTSQVVSMKGYSGITPPKYVLGLSNTKYPITIPYGK